MFWGGIGGYDQGNIRDFAGQSGKRPAVNGFFIKWKANSSALHWIGFRFSYAKAQRARPMFNVEPTPGLSPRKIARGEGDGFLVAMTRMIAATGQVTYMRLMSEMNNARELLLAARPEWPVAWAGLQHRCVQGRLAPLRHHPPRRRRGEHEPAAEAPPPAECPDGSEAVAAGAGGPGLGAALVRESGDRVQPPEVLLAGRRLRGLGGHHLVLEAPQLERDGSLLPLPEVAQQAVRVRRVGRVGRRVAVVRGQVLRLPEGTPARADGHVLPVRQPQAGVPPVDASALARGAAQGGRLAAPVRPGARVRPVGTGASPAAHCHRRLLQLGRAGCRSVAFPSARPQM